MAKVPDLSIVVHVQNAEELKPGSVYMIHMPDDLPPAHLNMLVQQLDLVRKQYNIRFVVFPPSYKIVNAMSVSAFMELPEFQRVVEAAIEKKLAAQFRD